MAKSKPVKFQLIHIDTPQFATLPENHHEDCSIQFNHDFKVGADDENNTVRIELGVNFLCEAKVFIKYNVECIFNIDNDDFKKFFKEKPNQLVLPKDFITHLMMLTIGIARGSLFEKLRSTQFNEMNLYLPSINLKELVKGDITLDKSET